MDVNNIEDKIKKVKRTVYNGADRITSQTIYNERYLGHIIKIVNAFSKVSLYIDGEEQDEIQGVILKESGLNLYGKILEGGREIIVECKGDIIDGFFSKEVKGTKINVFVEEDLLGSFYMEGASQRKYMKKKKREERRKKKEKKLY